MQRTNYTSLITIIITFPMIISSVHADILRGDDPPQITDIYTNLDEWLAAVPPVTVIDFTGLPPDTLITDQYSDLGITFEPHNNIASFIQQTGSFLADGWGLANNSGRIIMQFDEPLTIFASLFPGATTFFQFYFDGELVGWTQNQGLGQPGTFAGFILDTPFDEVHMFGTTFVSTDNLYFTFAPIPAPGALALLGIAGLAFRRSRCRRSLS